MERERVVELGTNAVARPRQRLLVDSGVVRPAVDVAIECSRVGTRAEPSSRSGDDDGIEL